MNIPTFDEWHKGKYGFAWAEHHIFPGKRYDAVVLEYMNSTKEYIHEVLTQVVSTYQPTNSSTTSGSGT